MYRLGGCALQADGERGYGSRSVVYSVDFGAAMNFLKEELARKKKEMEKPPVQTSGMQGLLALCDHQVSRRPDAPCICLSQAGG